MSQTDLGMMLSGSLGFSQALGFGASGCWASRLWASRQLDLDLHAPDVRDATASGLRAQRLGSQNAQLCGLVVLQT